MKFIFCVINGICSFFHYHEEDVYYYNKNSRGLAWKFEKIFQEKSSQGIEEFILEKAEKEGCLVIELKEQAGGGKYRYARKKEIEEFKKFLKE